MNKIAIITGGSRGIGHGLAEVYHQNGYQVISISRTIIEKEYAIEQYACDLSDIQQIEKTITEIFSHLDKKTTTALTLFNNAGTISNINTIDKLSSTDIQTDIQVNLIAPMLLSSLFIELSKDWTCKKKIINISSGAAINPYDSWTTYCASKAGLDMMTRVISKEQKDIKNGVKVTSVYPGIVDTEMQTKIRSIPKETFKTVQRFIDFYEHGELHSPKQVAEKIYYLDATGKLKNGKIIDIRNV
ncbi:MAG: SDR family NAD(P)-dependent oxidoreductase [Lutibacter sp.]|nr:SDR family NAD(P)-dependent oxidoreductase [Lutibacter sp.]MBP9602148.1 SDR family NAD(P)-dependent oxidoreductase [Lutibacter sp.]